MKTALHILNVEDSTDDSLFIEREMQRHFDLKVFRRVENAQELADALKNQRWDFILSDYSMPGFAAEDALETTISREPPVPFIIISDAIGEETAADMMRAGARDFVRKGDWDRLLAVLNREIADKKTRRELTNTRRQLDKSEDLRLLALESARLVSWDWNVQNGTLDFDERWSELSGYSSNVSKMSIHSFEELVHPEDRSVYKEAFAAHIAGKTNGLEVEYRIRHGSGRWIWVLDRGRILERDAV